jgi:hypothetical protein
MHDFHSKINVLLICAVCNVRGSVCNVRNAVCNVRGSVCNVRVIHNLGQFQALSFC